MRVAIIENNSKLKQVLEIIIAERRHQNLKWGESACVNLNPAKQLCILMEEVGELAEAINETYHNSGYLQHKEKSGIDNIFNESIQVAAVASAIAESVLNQKNDIKKEMKGEAMC